MNELSSGAFRLTTSTIAGRESHIYRADKARHVLIQPVDDHDQNLLNKEVGEIARLTSMSFTLAAFKINDWNSELTPWQAPPVFGKKPFGDKAASTLDYIITHLLPALQEQGISTAHCILDGYSLAGLFALWSGYTSSVFNGIAAASPSVWYPGWIAFINDKKPLCQNIYLSLGDKEEHTRNPIMAQVGHCINRQHQALQQQGVNTTLHWNPGNHFATPHLRMAQAFAWLLNQ